MKNKNKLGLGLTIGTGTSNFKTISNQLNLAETQDLEFVELSVYDWNIICGKKIIASELKKLINICKKSRLNYTVHGELSVNLLDKENIKSHMEVLKRDIEISSSINAKHLVTHFGITTNKIYNNRNKFKDLLKIQQEAYYKIGDFAKSHDVIITVENLYNFFNDKIYVPLPSVVGKQLDLINHPNIKATLDFSHAYINSNYYRSNFMKEISKMANLSKHLHVHDSFGLLKNIYTYNESEELSYGLGDLHLPLGWGNIPFEKIFDKLIFPKGLIMVLEIQERFIDYIPETIKKARYLFNKAKILNGV